LHLFIVTACIQGGVIISQFLIAPIVGPSVVGEVRALETILALVVLAGSLGMQSIATRDTAACRDEAAQRRVLHQVFILVCLSASVVMVGIFLANRFMFHSALSASVYMACGVVLLTNLLRVTTGYAQGAKAISEIYVVLLLATGVGVALHVVLTKNYGIQGWVAARYITEVICLAGVWWRLRQHVFAALRMPGTERGQLWDRAFSGVTNNASLFVRLLVDSLPVLMLTALHARVEEIGFFGLANLSLVFGLLPLAILAQRAITDLVDVLDDKQVLVARFNGFLRSMLLISSAMAAALVIVALVWLFGVGGQYQETAKYVAILAVSLPLKAGGLACGTMLLALRVFGLSLKVNMLEGLLVLLILFFGIPNFGGWAGVMAYMAGTLLSVVLLMAAVKIRLANHYGSHDHAGR